MQNIFGDNKTWSPSACVHSRSSKNLGRTCSRTIPLNVTNQKCEDFTWAGVNPWHSRPPRVTSGTEGTERGSYWMHDGDAPVGTESIRGLQAGHHNKAHFLLYDKWTRPCVSEHAYNEMMEICRTLIVFCWWRWAARLRTYLWLCFCLRCQGSITEHNVVTALITATMMIMIMMQ